jgi:hypothetical protein
MADVMRARFKKLLDFALQQRFVEIDVYRQLRIGARKLGKTGKIGHPYPPN